MRLMAFDKYDAQRLNPNHLGLARQILSLMDDLGEDCDLTISLDDLENPDDSEFCFYFAGSDLFLHYTYDGIFVEMIDEDGIESEIVKVFPLDRTNEATHWLLTQES